MHVRLSSPFMVPAIAAAALAFAGAASATPPPAPIFYCPKAATPPPQACPTVERKAGHRQRARKVRAHATRSRVHRQVRVTRAERPYNPEDDGVSASQAWSYKYQLSQGGLRLGEAEERHLGGWGRHHGGRRYGEHRHWGHEEAYDDSARDDDSDRYGDSDRYDDSDGYAGARDYEDSGAHEDQGRDRWSAHGDEGSGYRYYGGGDASGAYSSRWSGGYAGGRVEADSGAPHAYVGEPAYFDDRDRDDGRDAGDRYSAERHYRFMQRRSSGGYVEGEDNGVPYGWSWGDMSGRPSDGGWSDQRRADSGFGYGGGSGWSGGHGERSRYGAGGYTARRGVWYDTVDQAVPYAGRDADGYLVWPGKTPR